MSSDDESSVDLSLLSEGEDDLPQAVQHNGADSAEPAGGDGDGDGSAGRQLEAGKEGTQQRVGGTESVKKKKKKKPSKVLSKEKLQRLKEKHQRRGIVYVSRIPPHMKPAKLRQLLSQYGEVGRVYCTPEDQALRRKRKQHGGNTGKNFTEGWVEFEDKAAAKAVAAMLNSQPIGGKHRSAYKYDLWCLKYLPKFKWDHLTEEINYEKAVREQRLAAELSAAKRERDFYLSRVDHAKAMAAMEKRRVAKEAAGGGSSGGGEQQQRQQEEGSGGGQTGKEESGGSGRAGRAVRHYGQRRAKPDPVTAADAPQLGEDVLGMVVAKKRKLRASTE